ncbi:MAG: cell division protein FtsL [Eubacterium sp.]|nr:cell division protein FtsL [Eubacterium sp.]
MARENNIRNMYYMDGSTVRKIQAEPAPRRREPERQKRKKRQSYTYRAAAVRAEKSLYFDRGYAVVLLAAILIMIVSCVVMLSIQSRVNEQELNIEAMQEQVQQMEANNMAREDAMESKYSLNQIYDVATKELGMVYSQKGQIVYYEGANEDYVKQMMDVPEAK